MAIILQRVNDVRAPVAGTVIINCDKCGADCWFPPSLFHYLGRMTFFCNVCKPAPFVIGGCGECPNCEQGHSERCKGACHGP